MTESESVALPFGDSPIVSDVKDAVPDTNDIILQEYKKSKYFLKKSKKNFAKFFSGYLSTI